MGILFSTFLSPPTTSDDVLAAGGSLDEMHIVVLDEDGGITGTAGEILETFEGVSQASDGKTSTGSSNFYADVIYTHTSKFVYVMDHESTLANDSGSVRKKVKLSITLKAMLLL